MTVQNDSATSRRPNGTKQCCVPHLPKSLACRCTARNSVQTHLLSYFSTLCCSYQKLEHAEYDKLQTALLTRATKSVHAPARLSKNPLRIVAALPKHLQLIRSYSTTARFVVDMLYPTRSTLCQGINLHSSHRAVLVLCNIHIRPQKKCIS